MRLLSIFAVAAFLLAPFASYGATISEPAYRSPEIFRSGLSDIGIVLAVDEAECKKLYGAKWRAKCAAAPGRCGETVKGVRTTPRVKGRWVWNDSASMLFEPEAGTSLAPGAIYAIDLSKIALPASVKLAKNNLTVRTWPLAARLQNLEFLTDPSPEARHRVVLSLKFNYPVPTDFAPPRISAPGVDFGAPEIVWNGARDELNMAWPVEAPRENAVDAKIDLGKIGQIYENKGELFYSPAPENGLALTREIPGLNSIFKINSIEISPALNENLDQEFELEIASSLYARPEDVLAHLAVLQLPEKNSPEALEPYNWELTPGISDAAIKRATRVALTPADGSGPRSKFKFRLRPDDDRYLLVVVDKDLKSCSGVPLAAGRVRIVRAQGRGASLGFPQPGNILPLSRNGALDLYATDLDRIHWEASRVAEPFLALMASGQYIFENGYASGAPAMDAITERLEGDLFPAFAGEGKAQFAALEMGEIIGRLNGDENSRSGLVLLNLTGYRGGESKAWASRLILATDLGLLVKKSTAGEYHCFVQSLRGGEPVKGALVRILGANGKAVASGETDADGYFRSPALAGLLRESRPAAAVAQLGSQIAWLPLEDAARKTDFSQFAVGGVRKFANGLNAFVFGQRDMYRPGDALNFGVMIRNGDFAPLGDDLPVWTEIIDPRGTRVYGATATIGRPGLAGATWIVPADAATGKYVFNVRAGKDGAILGSKIARVEEFIPDSLKLRADVPVRRGWLKPEEASLTLRLRNLYGSPAVNRKIRVSVSAEPASFRFPDFEDFVFADPAPLAVAAPERILPASPTDERGETTVSLAADFARLTSARARLVAEGFDADGGRATVQTAQFLVSPADKILGYRPLNSLTSLDFVPAGSKAEIELIALDNELNRAAWDGLDFSVARKEYAVNLVSDSRGGYRYEELPVNNPIKSWRASVPAKGVRVKLPADQAGEFVLLVNNDGKLICEIPYAVAGDNPRPPNQAPDMAKIRARTDKSEYEPGETARVRLSLPFAGSGLLALERDGVEAFSWFVAEAGDTVQTLELPRDFEGKGYVTVSFVRSTDSPAVYMKPYLSAALPILVNMKNRDLGVAFSAPKSIEPGQPLKINVKANQPGKALVYAVDEGILALTNYRTPRPVYELLGNRALNVESVQAYDLLMPDRLRFSRPAFGGGADGLAFGGKFRNPFARKHEPPLVFWSGLVDVGPEPREFVIPIPAYYNGSLRAFAVAASENGAGAASADIAVAAPIVPTPALPLVLSPGDRFQGSLNIANNEDRERTIALTWDFGEGLKPVASLPGTATIPARSEILLPFEAEALDTPGPAVFKIIADADGRRFERESYLAIRPFSPLKTTFQGGRVSGSFEIVEERRVYETDAASSTLVSPSPLPLIRAFNQYLEYYPHGCTEQLISRAFAMLAARGWGEDDAKIEKQIAATLAAIKTRFNGRGVSLWPGGEPDPLLTVYAADFLLAAQGAGYAGDGDLLLQLCDIVRDNCAVNDGSLSSARAAAYGIWVLTRAGRVTTQLIENLLNVLAQRPDDAWRFDVTVALLAASQRELGIRAAIPFERLEFDDDGWFDEYAQRSLAAYLLDRYFPEKFAGQAREDYYEASRNALAKGVFATFSASQGARALTALGSGERGSLLETRISCEEGDAGEYRSIANGKALEFVVPRCSRLKVDAAPGSDLFWQTTVRGYDKGTTAKPENRGLSVKKSYTNRRGDETDAFEQGEEITVTLEARSESGEEKECVVADLLPGGVELILGRGDEAAPDNIKHVERREDRVLIYVTLGAEPVRFAYKARAVNRGRFAAPPTRVEAMYDQTAYGQSGGGAILVR